MKEGAGINGENTIDDVTAFVESGFAIVGSVFCRFRFTLRGEWALKSPQITKVQGSEERRLVNCEQG